MCVLFRLLSDHEQRRRRQEARGLAHQRPVRPALELQRLGPGDRGSARHLQVEVLTEHENSCIGLFKSWFAFHFSKFSLQSLHCLQEEKVLAE